MANLLWKDLDPLEQESYIKKLKVLGALSGLFKDLAGNHGSKPYLQYRNHEISFIDSFKVEGITRKDSAFDAIANIKGKKVGIGLKTWIHTSDITVQKVAEFNKKSKKLRALFDANKNEELVKEVSKLRNERIDDDKRLYGTSEDVYHFVTRDDDIIYITECLYDKIDIENISDIKKTKLKGSIRFSDGKSQYLFNMSKSTLFKTFDASEEERIIAIPINIIEDPFSVLSNAWDTSHQIEIKNNNLKKEFIILPLYSDYDYDVPKASSFNASLGKPKNKNSETPRPAYEAYANIPLYIHHLYPNFFGFNALNKEARADSQFDLHLPDGNKITAKITQDNGKGLQSNPQSILGKWLLFSIFGLEPYEQLTRELLNEKGIDSIRVTKIDNQNFKVEVCDFLEYEDWKLKQKEAIEQLKQEGKIVRLPVFRKDLIDAYYHSDDEE